MKHKFTNGLWKVGHRKNLVISDMGASIADVKFTHSDSKNRVNPNVEECIANAQLISAAPELLFALELFVNWKITGAPAIDHVMNTARMAIEKAVG